MPIRLPVTLSPSRAELACRCHRRHVLHEVVDRRSFNSPSAAFGTVVHKGASEWWGTGNNSKALFALQMEWDKYRTSLESGSDRTQAKHSLPMAEEMLESYIEKAKLVPIDFGMDYYAHEEWRLLSDAEGEFLERRVEIAIHGKILSFQLDRALTDGDDICIADLKTTSKLDDRVEATWKRSLQQKLYVVGVRQKFPWAKNIYSYIEALEKKATPVFKLVELPQWTAGQLDEALEIWLSCAEEDELIIGKGMELAVERFKVETPSPEQLRECVEEVAVTQTSFNYMDCYSYWLECPYLRKICEVSPELRVGALWADFEIHETEGY